MASALVHAPVQRSVFESRNTGEVADLISRRYVGARQHVLDAGQFVFRSVSAEAGGLGVDLLTLWTRVRFDTDPFVRFTVVSLFDGRYTVGGGRTSRGVARGGSVLFAPGTPASVLVDRIRHHVVQFPAAAIDPVAGRLGVEPADLRFEGTAPVSAAMNRHWRATAAYVSRTFAGPDPAVAHPLLLASAVETAAAAVLAAFPNTTMSVGYVAGPGREPPATVRRAVAFIDAHAGEPITLEEIAAAGGVGARGLQAAFARHRDTTPTGYLRRVRLERAHRDLQAADRSRGDTVAAIARRWGFASPGRFSIEYRRVFGRSPSHTLRA